MNALLYRPTGLRELQLIAEAGWRAWPPRLPDQPIFYPVLTLDYAVKIAKEWNAVDKFSSFIGFVTRFQLQDSFAAQYPVQRAGGRAHEELWVPAGDLPRLNEKIRGFIEVVAGFPGPSFEGTLDPQTHLPLGIAAPRIMPDSPGLSCPCCRYLTLPERGGYEICPVCFWEDDGQDDLDAEHVRGGPNARLSLVQARSNYAQLGACSAEHTAHVRKPLPFEE